MPSNLLMQTEVEPDGLAVAAVGGGVFYTWDGVESRARRFAAALSAEGLEPGDRWALMAHNRIEWTPLILGNLRAGTRYVPINWHLTVEEVAYFLTDSQSRLLVVDSANAAVGRAAADLVGLERVITLDPVPGVGEFEDWIAAHGDVEPPDGLAGSVRNYTSGTTGQPKGVRRSDERGTADQVIKRASDVMGHFF